MNPNPLSDTIAFLLQPGWTTAIFWLFLAASIAIAAYAYRTIPGQHSLGNLSDWGFRLMIGGMWWQQSLWKLPPSYTDHPEQPFGDTGLAYWMRLMGQHAAIPVQADFVNNVVLPHFYWFAPVVYGLEVLTGVSLMLGVFVRLFGIIGALQILNLWLGLYGAPGEWPWTYFFLLALMLIFALHRYGRSLGLDAIMMARLGQRRTLGRALLAEAS